MMGRPPRALKDARYLISTGAFVLVIGVLAFSAGALLLSRLDQLGKVEPVHDFLIIVGVLFLVVGFGNFVLGAEVIHKAVKIARALKGGGTRNR